MSNGQILFYSGAALMAVTILLAIFFCIKKPKYEPTNIVYEEAEERGTQKLRSGYPTVRLTRRWEGRTRKTNTEAVETSTVSALAAAPLEPNQAPHVQQLERTLPLAKTDETEVLTGIDGGTEILTDLDRKTEVLTASDQGTVLLSATAPLAQSGTTVLSTDASDGEADRLEILGKNGENRNA